MGGSKSSFKSEVIAINVYIEKQEKSQINNLTLHFQELEKEEESPKLVARKK